VTDPVPPPISVVGPGEGRSGWLGTIGVQFKLWGRDTGGAFAVVEHPFPVGALVPAHLHTRESEYSIVTEGTIGFRSGNREAVLEAGGYIVKPAGEVHAMWNAGRAPARMIEIISPAGFEHFFREVCELLEAGTPSPDEGMSLAGRYGLRFAEPDWIPDVVRRFGLDSPSATEPRA
jgi:quercetin dioxygenase-like cupin family protein